MTDEPDSSSSADTLVPTPPPATSPEAPAKLTVDEGAAVFPRSQAERISFLSTLARDLPDHYMCTECMALHSATAEECHAKDVAIIENSSYKKGPTVMEAALHAPCQRTAITADAYDFRLPREPPKDKDAAVTAERYQHALGFMGQASSSKRTPLAGLTHRDVQLTLKRARLLTSMETAESEKKAKGESSGDGGHVTATQRKYRKNGFAEIAADMAMRQDGETLKSKTADVKKHRQQLTSRLQLALAPIKADCALTRTDRASTSSYPYVQKTTVKYTFAARIEQARYLLKTTVKMARSEVANVSLAICPHLLLNHHKSEVWADMAREAVDACQDCQASGATKPFALQMAVRHVGEAMAASVRHARHMYNLGGCDVDEMDANECDSDHDRADKEMDGKQQPMRRRGSCHRCATDFAVRGLLRADQIMLCVWQDLGGETDVTDAHWQSHVAGTMLPIDKGQGAGETTNLWNDGLTMAHTAGDVRALYEGRPGC
ncbi:hypothetical protein SPBR_04235 [Sporothrix brasiliensis 5110]|uniref:Uncharacterized protein n=1 Tax=Sporothrix brasiliensis 5110 TaxID=1398154 RepID=A0A0C2IWV8_9PEZI|nr:uncharacterized protein SPBR_04235 [Sporothrix brasiliensis 5110]KIH93621.1 hypothetical protein SPBR_04235 [Sporothrix brasiliensis 5110]